MCGMSPWSPLRASTEVNSLQSLNVAGFHEQCVFSTISIIDVVNTLLNFKVTVNQTGNVFAGIPQLLKEGFWSDVLMNSRK